MIDMSLDQLSEPAVERVDKLNARIKWIYGKSRYIVVLLFSDFVGAAFGMFANSVEDGLVYNTVAFLLCWCAFLVSSHVVKTSKRKALVWLTWFSAYFMQMFLSGVLGNLQSLAYQVGTKEYLLLTAGMLAGMLLGILVLAYLYIKFNEWRIIEVDQQFNIKNGRYKDSQVIKTQIQSMRIPWPR